MRGIRNRKLLEIARERIEILLSSARETALSVDFILASEYVRQARKISMKYRVRIPRQYRPHLCKTCGSFLVPHENARYRIKRHRVVVQCLNCGSIKRYPLK